MIHFEKLQSMCLDELAEWLDEYVVYNNDLPWVQWWDSRYCKNCEPIMGHYENREQKIPYAWCEIHGKCKFFQEMNEIPNNKEIIKMWLQSEDGDELDELFALNDKRVDEMIEFEEGFGI